MPNPNNFVDKIHNPAFTGDVLFHERLDLLFKQAYSIQNLGNNFIFCSVIKNILSEIYRYIDINEAKKFYTKLKEIKQILIKLEFQRNKVVTSPLESAKITEELEDVLFRLIVLAHKARLILKDKDSADSAFDDMA